MEEKTIYWHLPGICYYGMINHVLFDFMKKFPDKFEENYKIGSVYGTFPGAIWNGGRTMLEGFSKKSEVAKIIKAYNDRDIPVRFTWTNVLLEKEHVYDTYCNMIMKVGDNGFNQVLVNSPELEEHIRTNYPNYKIISSTTKRILDLDNLMDEVSKDYYLVVLDYDLNHNQEVLDKLAPEAGRIEILVNEVCPPHCPARAAHYKTISKCQLEFEVSEKAKNFCIDRSPERRSLAGVMKRPSFISHADVAKYAEKGFVNFKIVGRGLSPDYYIDSLMYYLVKPEYRDEVSKMYKDTLMRLRRAPQR